MVNLVNLRPDEKVLHVIKRHWIAFVFLGVYFLIGVVLTIALFVSAGMSTTMLLLAVCFWMFFALFLYVEWVNYELDMFIVTNNRIVGVEQISFLNRSVSECNLGQVQEVNAQTKGLLANIFNFGRVMIQTAGNASDFELEFVPHAIHTSRNILNIVDSYRDNNPVATTPADPEAPMESTPEETEKTEA